MWGGMCEHICGHICESVMCGPLLCGAYAGVLAGDVRGYMRVSFGGGESDVFRLWCSDDLVILRSAFGFWDSLEGGAFSW